MVVRLIAGILLGLVPPREIRTIPVPPTNARIGILAVAQAVIWCVLAKILLRPSFHVQDLALCYNASGSVLRGLIPYRDFPLEYPPLALIPMTLPRLLGGGASLRFPPYVWLLLAENTVWMVVLEYCVLRIARRWMSTRDVMIALVLFGVLAMIGAPILAWRVDLFPALLTAAAVVAVLENHPAIAGSLIGLGAATKLYPLVLLPVLVAWYAAAGNRRGVVRLMGATAGISALALLPFIVLAGTDVFSFVRYHELRGLEIESTPAGVLMLVHRAGLLPLSLVENYGAMHVRSPAAAIVQRWLLGAFLVALSVVTVRAFRRFRRESQRSDARAALLVDYVLASLLVFIVTNKVFSPQYLAWILPFAPLLSRGRVAIAMAVFGLTTAIFPYGFEHLIEMRAAPVILLNARNLLAAALAIWLCLGTTFRLNRRP